MPGYRTGGFEIGNFLDRRAYPTARRNRTGPPPAAGAGGDDPLAPRGAPIRSSVFAFAVQETAERALVASPSFVGPGLVKRLDLSQWNTGETAVIGHFNIFYNTSPYVTAVNLPLTTLPGGTPIFRPARAAVPGADYADEGGLTTRTATLGPGNFLLDYYIPDAQFFLALVFRNPQAVAAGFAGSVLVYEGVLVSDFPAILG